MGNPLIAILSLVGIGLIKKKLGSPSVVASLFNNENVIFYSEFMFSLPEDKYPDGVTQEWIDKGLALFKRVCEEAKEYGYLAGGQFRAIDSAVLRSEISDEFYGDLLDYTTDIDFIDLAIPISVRINNLDTVMADEEFCIDIEAVMNPIDFILEVSEYNGGDVNMDNIENWQSYSNYAIFLLAWILMLQDGGDEDWDDRYHWVPEPGGWNSNLKNILSTTQLRRF